MTFSGNRCCHSVRRRNAA